MQKLFQLLTFVFLLLVFSACIAFFYYNTTAVTISFGPWQLPEQPVSVWIIASFVLGGALGLVLGFGVLKSFKSRVDMRRLKKQLEAKQLELEKLQSRSFQNLP